MSTLLNGYDLVVSISQTEINSQFAHLYKTGIIYQAISADSLTADLFGSDDLILSSYIRGGITSPVVTLAQASNPYETEFSFSFCSRTVVPPDLNVSSTDFETAFALGGTDSVDGLLITHEDIKYMSDNRTIQTSKAQKVYYWLQRKEIKTGTLTRYEYCQVPCLYFYNKPYNILVSLDKLQLSFKVDLSKIPTTSDAIQQNVLDKKAPKELLDTIKNNGFDSEAFSLTQLFLDFDSVDFSVWDLTDPAKELSNSIPVMELMDDRFKVSSIQLDKMQSSSTFVSSFSTNLQEAFGEVSKISSNRGDYVIGIAASSTNPATINQNDPPSLVPTYIGFSTTANPSNPVLSSLNYEILCGTAPLPRVPKNADQSVINITTPFILSDDFSGEMLFSADSFFYPFVLNPLQTSMNTGAGWTPGDAPNTWVSHYTAHTTLDEYKSVTAGAGSHGWTTQDDDNTYEIQIKGNQILIAGKLQRITTVERRDVLFGKDSSLRYAKWQTGTIQWTNNILLTIDENQQLIFTSAPNFPAPTISDRGESKIFEIENKITKGVSDEIDDKLTHVRDMLDYTLTLDLGKSAKKLSQNLLISTRNNFIPPTGQVYLLNNPRFNQELNLQMDVTYSD